MRTLVVLLFLGLVGCNEKQIEKHLIDVPSSGVADVWEYINQDGLCDASEDFGDSPNGCLLGAQLIRFADGTAYFSLNMGPNVMTNWNWSGYIVSDDGTFLLVQSVGSGIYFKIEGDISGATPVMDITYDSNGNYSDTAAGSVALVVVP